jgi:hypothetical protein
VRECDFFNGCLSVDTTSSGQWEYMVEEVPLNQSIDSEGAQTQFSRTPSSGLTGPPRTALVSNLSRRQMVGAEASENQRLMSMSRVLERIEPHLAIEMSK